MGELCQYVEPLTGVGCELEPEHDGPHMAQVEHVLGALDHKAHERAFRAMREALERVAEDAIQDDAVDDRVILPDETLTIVERALALAQEVEEDA